MIDAAYPDAPPPAVPVLEARELRKHFVVSRDLLGRPRARVAAVDGVSFALAAGETLAIVGESGCGKSTVGRLLMRLIEPGSGRILLDGQDVTALGHEAMRRRRRDIQLVFQDPYASLNPRMTIAQTVAEPLALHGIVPAAGRRARVEELLRLVGLRADHADRYPHEFSGGQRQRAVIARALASEPRVIVCDEAVSALDVSIQAQILNLLKDLQHRLGLALIFISHDLSVVRHVADRVAVMYLGKLVELGTAGQVFSRPRHPYTRALMAAIPIPRPGARGRGHPDALKGDLSSPIDLPPGCRLHPRCPHARPDCDRVAMDLLAEPDGHANACAYWRDLPPAEAQARPAAPRDPRLERLFAAFDRPATPAAAAATAAPATPTTEATP
jgi:peptide/nickel transport system ATP-binding protein/oligopeptide transport system ATP-binding protein